MAKKYERKRVTKGPKTLSGRTFSGVLLEPIIIPHFPEFTGDPDTDAKLEEVRTLVRNSANEQLSVRVGALAEHYGMGAPRDIQSLSALLRKLAADFLPGFTINPGQETGRPYGTRSDAGGEALYHAVNAHVDKNGGTVADACRHLHLRGPKTFRNHGSKRLADNYRKFLKAAVEAYTQLAANPSYAGTIDAIGIDGIIAQAEIRAKPKI